MSTPTSYSSICRPKTWNSPCKIAMVLTIIGFMLFEIYDLLFVTSYNRMCLREQTSESVVAIYVVLGAFIMSAIPTVLSRSRFVLGIYAIIAALGILVLCVNMSELVQHGADRYGECFTFNGDHYDQTLPLVTSILIFFASTILFYFVLVSEFVFYGIRKFMGKVFLLFLPKD